LGPYLGWPPFDDPLDCLGDEVPAAAGPLDHRLDPEKAVFGHKILGPILFLAEEDQVLRAPHDGTVDLNDLGVADRAGSA
jgi:hypothetical protein